jgi:hypothetical protein
MMKALDVMAFTVALCSLISQLALGRMDGENVRIEMHTEEFVRFMMLGCCETSLAGSGLF